MCALMWDSGADIFLKRVSYEFIFEARITKFSSEISNRQIVCFKTAARTINQSSLIKISILFSSQQIRVTHLENLQCFSSQRTWERNFFLGKVSEAKILFSGVCKIQSWVTKHRKQLENKASSSWSPRPSCRFDGVAETSLKAGLLK